jgi:hypothetical protein
MQLNFGHNLVLVLIWVNIKLYFKLYQKYVIFICYLGEENKIYVKDRSIISNI